MAYYRTEAGKIKKKLQNDKRRKTDPPAENSEGLMSQAPRKALPGDGFEPGMVCYLQMVTGLIEGRRVSRAAVLEMLARAVRQHSMASPGNVVYPVCYVKREPP